MFALAASLALAGPVVLPVRRVDSGHVLLDVDLGPTGTGTFVLDTGASRTAISSHTASRLGIPADKGRRVGVQTMGGAVPARLVPGRFAVGGIVVDRDRVTVVDLDSIEASFGEPIAGILGRDFFETVDVALDLTNDQLTLYDRGTFAADGSWSAVPFSFWHGLVEIPVRLGDADSRVIVDTGANTSIISRWGVLRGHGTLDPVAAFIAGVDGRPVTVRAATFDEVALGDVILRDFQFSVCDNRDCPIGLGAVDRALLGIDAFEHRTTVWSYAQKRMYLSKPGRPPP